MKTVFSFLIFLFSLMSFSQSDKAIGNYALSLVTKENDLFEYELTLSQDGTFLFHYHSSIKRGVPPEIDKYAKGNYSIKENVIKFDSDKKQDFDAKHTLDFTNTTARFLIKSDRNKTDQVSKIKLQFLQSEIFWIKKIKMNKI